MTPYFPLLPPNHPPQRLPGRPAFTLVELLVAIAIIAILVSLTVVGVIRFLSKGPETQNANEIRQLETAVTTFKTQFGHYPPSKIRLRRNRADYVVSDPYELESLSYISAFWPNLPLNWTINWDNELDPSGVLPDGKPGWDLEGDQCLVFFLGGPPGRSGTMPPYQPTGGVAGFSTNKANPAQPPVQGETRISFFEFTPARLYNRVLPQLNTKLNQPGIIVAAGGQPLPPPVQGPSPTPPPTGPGQPPSLTSPTLPPPTLSPPPNKTSPNLPPGSGPVQSFGYPFLSFKDVYGKQPFVYFSSGKRDNGYQMSHWIVWTFNSNAVPYEVNIGPWVEAESPLKYINYKTFQIMSAGADGKWGSAAGNNRNLWRPQSASTDARGDPLGTPPEKLRGIDAHDNQSNFHGAKLGVNE